MIGYIKGKVVKRLPPKVYVEISEGICLEVLTPVYGNRDMEEGESVRLFTHLISKEDTLELYGFLKEEEKELFLKLIGVSGIGPRVALNILSRVSVEDFARMVSMGDYESLSRVQGIGSKRAKRILVELRDTIPTFSDGKTKLLRDALSSLGYKRKEIDKVLEVLRDKIDKLSEEDIVREALRILGNG